MFLNRWRDVTDASEEIENTAEENKTELPEEVLHSFDEKDTSLGFYYLS